MKDELASWVSRHRAALDALAPPADGWAAVARALDAPDALEAFTGAHAAAFDALTPRPALWEGIELALTTDDGAGRIVRMPAPAPAVQPTPLLRASRGAAAVAGRPTWWQLAAAAVVVFGLGYGLRVQTEPEGAVVAFSSSIESEPVVGEQRTAFASAPRHFHDEPDPAMRAALLTQPDEAAETASGERADDQPERDAAALRHQLAPEVRRLEARYEALLAEKRVGRTTRPLVDDWDREMAVLDSTYVELRRELTRNANTDRVVAAMTRNLHLRIELLNQQTHALEAAQQARQRAITPHRPPSVNPDATPGADEPTSWPTDHAAPSAPAFDGRPAEREAPRPSGHGPMAVRPVPVRRPTPVII